MTVLNFKSMYFVFWNIPHILTIPLYHSTYCLHMMFHIFKIWLPWPSSSFLSTLPSIMFVTNLYFTPLLSRGFINFLLPLASYNTFKLNLRWIHLVFCDPIKVKKKILKNRVWHLIVDKKFDVWVMQLK